MPRKVVAMVVETVVAMVVVMAVVTVVAKVPATVPGMVWAKARANLPTRVKVTAQPPRQLRVLRQPLVWPRPCPLWPPHQQHWPQFWAWKMPSRTALSKMLIMAKARHWPGFLLFAASAHVVTA